MQPIDVTMGSNGPSRAMGGPFRVSTASFRPELRIESHFHDWACVSVILEGRFEQRFPGRVLDCPRGAILAKAPKERHTDRWFGAWTRHLMIEIDPARHSELGESRIVAEEIHWFQGMAVAPITYALVRELDTLDSVTPLAIEGLVFQLLANIRRAADRPVGGDWPAWVGVARDYLHANFRTRVKLGDVAAAAGVHPDSVSRLFPKAFSCSVGAYVRRLRVEAAAELLTSSELPISIVALRVGFADQSHLTRVFKAQMGMPPGAYRSAVRGSV